MVARSKAWFCGLSFAGTAVSNTDGGTDVSLLLVLRVVMYRSLRGTDHSSREVLPGVAGLSVIVKPK